MGAATLDRKQFTEQLAKLAATAGDGRTFPIMSCVAIAGGVASTTTHDEFTRLSLSSNGLGVAVDCRRLLGVVRSLTGDDVEVAQKGSDVVVTSDRATFRLAGQDPKDFPAAPAIPDLMALTHDDLSGVVALAGRAANDYFGVLVSYDEGQFGLAATDGYRLVLHGRLIDGANRFTIHNSGLRALGGSGLAAIGHTDDWAFFGDDAAVVGVRRKDGRYPDVRAVAKRAYDADGVAHVDGRRFRDALARVLLMADDAARVAFVVDDGRLTIAATDARAGESLDSVPCEHSGTLHAKFNGRYLADWAKHADGDTAFRFSDGTGALHCTTTGLPETQYILMPMR